MTSATLREIGNIGIVLAAIPYVLFVVVYGLRSNWRSTEYGIHLMCFMGSLMLMLVIIVMRVLFFPVHFPLWYDILRTIAFVALIPPMGFWRLGLLLREQRDVRRELKELGEEELKNDSVS